MGSKKKQTFAEMLAQLRSRELRGTIKLRAALAAFAVEVAGRVALDVGASTGGFTVALLEAGAARVYAVDAGFGQLLGRLRQDARVVNLERTNLAALELPEPIDLVTVDLSYLSIALAAPQLPRAPELIALVKPMFELHLARAPTDEATIARAERAACIGLEATGWRVDGTIASPTTPERFVHARGASDRSRTAG